MQRGRSMRTFAMRFPRPIHSLTIYCCQAALYIVMGLRVVGLRCESQVSTSSSRSSTCLFGSCAVGASAYAPGVTIRGFTIAPLPGKADPFV